MKNLIKLSEREKEVLQLIAEELTAQEIAQSLYLSKNTIETHKRNLFVKLNARNAAGLIRRSFESGFLKIAVCIVFILQIGIGQNNSELATSIREDGAMPNANAILDLQGNKKGLLIPRLSQADINTMTTPIEESMLVYNTSLDRFQYYNGTLWVDISPRNQILDFDNDTYVNVETSNDKDEIEFYVGGTRAYSYEKTNTGEIVLSTNNINKMQIGAGAGLNNTGSGNVFLGPNSGKVNSSGYLLTYVGRSAGENATGHNNTMIGESSGEDATSGSYNTFLGSSSGFNNGSGSFNLMLGYAAGFNNAGTQNIFLGSSAGFNETGSSKLIIEPTNTTTPLVYGDFSSNYFRINGQLEVGSSSSNSTTYAFPTSDGDDGEVMVTDGSGNLSWEAKSDEKEIHISQYSFQNASPGAFTLQSNPSMGGATINTGGSAGVQSMHAPVPIPEGSTITGVEILYLDNSSSADIRAILIAGNALDASALDVIHFHDSSGNNSARQTSGVTSLNYTVPADHMVYIDSKNLNGPWDTNIRIYDVIITYKEN